MFIVDIVVEYNPLSHAYTSDFVFFSGSSWRQFESRRQARLAKRNNEIVTLILLFLE
jgi:hypothetical protein